jgi:predicted site-specific integrase-resolvase
MDRLIPFEKACTLLGAHPNSVRSWEERGQVRVVYTIGGKRRIPESEILRLTGTPAAGPKGLVAIYARVSSQEQKQKGDLERQAQALRHSRQLQGCPDAGLLVVTDVGSGLSDKRKGLVRLMKLAQDRAVTEIHVAHRDRLTRFGYGYLETYFTAHGVRLVVHEQPGAATPQEELVEDLLSIVTSFSGRLYGLRSHSKARALVDAVREVVSA